MINLNKYYDLKKFECNYNINIHLETKAGRKSDPYQHVCFSQLDRYLKSYKTTDYNYLVFNLVSENTKHLTKEEKEYYINFLLQVPEFKKYLSRQKRNIIQNNKFKINLTKTPAHHLNVILNLVRALQEGQRVIKYLYDLKDYKFKLTPLQRLVLVSSIVAPYNRAHWFDRVKKDNISYVKLRNWDQLYPFFSHINRFNPFFNTISTFEIVYPEVLEEFLINE